MSMHASLARSVAHQAGNLADQANAANAEMARAKARAELAIRAAVDEYVAELERIAAEIAGAKIPENEAAKVVAAIGDYLDDAQFPIGDALATLWDERWSRR